MASEQQDRVTYFDRLFKHYTPYAHHALPTVRDVAAFASVPR